MTDGPIEISSISTTIPKFISVRLIKFALALMSPTPGLPRSPSRSESGGGAHFFPLRLVSIGPNSLLSFLDSGFCFIPESLILNPESRACSSTALLMAAFSVGASGTISFLEKNFLTNAITSNFIEVLKMTKIDVTTSAASITADK